MFYFLIGSILTFITTANAWSKCNENTIIIPMQSDSPSCYRPKQSIQLNLEKIRTPEFAEFELAPLDAEFENIPSPEIRQFVHVENDQQGTKIKVISFLCSGELPLGADAFSESLEGLTNRNENERLNVDVFIATGHASDNLSISKVKKAKAKIFDSFIEIFEERLVNSEIMDIENSDIYVPNYLNKKLFSSFFSRTNSSLNACSKTFLMKMQDHLLENVSQTNPYPNVEIRKKRFSDKYKVKWTM
jgi:hypothetical protein